MGGEALAEESLPHRRPVRSEDDEVGLTGACKADDRVDCIFDRRLDEFCLNLPPGEEIACPRCVFVRMLDGTRRLIGHRRDGRGVDSDPCRTNRRCAERRLERLDGSRHLDGGRDAEDDESRTEGFGELDRPSERPVGRLLVVVRDEDRPQRAILAAITRFLEACSVEFRFVA